MPSPGHYKPQKFVAMGSDGTNQNQLHVDGNGIAKTQVVNAVNIIPHSTVDGHGSPSSSLNVTVANATVPMKLEDLSSSINADSSSGTGRSIAVGLKAKTNPSDASTGTFLRCDASGRLETVGVLQTEVLNASLSVASGGGGSDTAELEVKVKPRDGKLCILFETSTSGHNLALFPQFASTSGGTFYAFPLAHTELHDTGNAQILIIKDFIPPFLKVTVSQTTGSTISVKVTTIH